MTGVDVERRASQRAFGERAATEKLASGINNNPLLSGGPLVPISASTFP